MNNEKILCLAEDLRVDDPDLYKEVFLGHSEGEELGQSDDKDGSGSDNEEGAVGDKNANNNTAESGAANGKTADGEDNETPSVPTAPTPVAVGVDEVRGLVRETRDGGIGYIFNRTKDDERAALPKDRIGQFKFVLSRSAPFAYLVKQVMKHIRMERDETGLPNRVVVMVDFIFF